MASNHSTVAIMCIYAVVLRLFIDDECKYGDPNTASAK